MADVDLVVVGGGPAGLAAGLFGARAGYRTVIVESSGVGGAAVNCERIEDAPGFGDGVSGFTFGAMLAQQAHDSGCAMEFDEVTALAPSDDRWQVRIGENDVVARAVVVASGTRPRKLGVPREGEFEGRGISNCAHCDGGFFAGGAVVVAGGGDAALTDALKLTDHGADVLVVNPDPSFQAQDVYVRRVAANPRIESRHGAVIVGLAGDDALAGVVVREDGDRLRDVAASGVFVHVGREPNCELVDAHVALDETGRVVTDVRMRTQRAGLFAAGDVRAGSPGYMASAMGDGVVAARSAAEHLGDLASQDGRR